MQEELPKSFNLTKVPHKDAPMIIEKLNLWVKKNKTQLQENVTFEIAMFYPEYAKKYMKAKPAFGEINIQAFKTKPGQGVPEDLVIIKVCKTRAQIPAFADKKEFLAGNITQLQFCELKAPTLQEWKDSYHINTRCREFPKIPVLELAIQMISLAEKGEVPNLQEVLCDALWSIIGRESEEIPKVEIDIFVESCFGMMFAEFEMFEELEEWLPKKIYEEVSEKLKSCQNVFRGHLRKGIEMVKNPRLMKLLQITAKISYENGQFEAIDEPMLLGATMEGNTENRFNKFWRECGGETAFE